MTTEYKGFNIVFRDGAERYFVEADGFKADGYTSEALAKTAITKFVKAASTANVQSDVVPPKESKKVQAPDVVSETDYLLSTPANAEHLKTSIDQARQGKFAVVNGGKVTAKIPVAAGKIQSRAEKDGAFCGKTRNGRRVRAGARSYESLIFPSSECANVVNRLRERKRERADQDASRMAA